MGLASTGLKLLANATEDIVKKQFTKGAIANSALGGPSAVDAINATTGTAIPSNVLQASGDVREGLAKVKVPPKK